LIRCEVKSYFGEMQNKKTKLAEYFAEFAKIF